MKTMTLKETNDYVLSHGVLNAYGQVILTKPMKVFKKVYHVVGLEMSKACIANLIIPEHAIVNLAQTTNLKLRSDEACCVSIINIRTEQEVLHARSRYDNTFVYRPGRVYEPTCMFCTSKGECESGIHFFAELKLALEY